VEKKPGWCQTGRYRNPTETSCGLATSLEKNRVNPRRREQHRDPARAAFYPKEQ
jgi:hypothetical protein